MKTFNSKLIIGLCVGSLMLGMSSCSKFLDEQPRGIFTPGDFKTPNGINNSIVGLYAHLRNIYGQAYYYNACLTGTDEVTYAQSADENFQVMDFTGLSTMTAVNSRADVAWQAALPNINMASGIIENAPAVGTSPAIIAEAHFFRAFDYFLLVQTFGGVPLDLGGGELKYSTSVERKSIRNTVAEVYTRAIFPDLLKAISDLPDSPRLKGAVSKTVARLYLAKAYLTYAWWLENPKNIPTYPETGRTDPDGKTSGWYFQQAYDLAVAAIENPGPYSLQPTFYDVNVATNDRNNEILLFADHTEDSELYNGGSLSYGSGGAPDNFAGWMMTWNYTSLTSSKTTGWSTADLVNSVQREAVQALGRPWTRMAPTINVVTETFADKTNDSRYDGTFTTVYRGNWNKANITNPSLFNANNMPVKPEDAILTFLNEEPQTPINYDNKTYKSSIGAGVLPGRADYVISPEGISRRVYPGLWKLGPYRTDNGNGLGQPNAGSTRPFNIAKFSELYFIAAEAAVKGATAKAGKNARDLVNVIRGRAGVWRWDNNGNSAKEANHRAEMLAATPVQITLNYILAERSREYYGEGYRWYDLVRTQTWSDIAKTYRIAGSNVGDHTAATFTRSIQPFHYLRPIPQGQLDAMDMSAAEKAAYQNPGYN
ncbi:RagB/SusD family nutrient uptake outer membrane protein [Sphingobacterium sp. N143]|uniref:RagB/SusD family nutrient uptake outer membrane protein n=1 Tax=Sphingobacterium sp. N143 TaxID=2746727 RepID=UPI0025766A8F|nr:RagB/SusD family nutrient uptake outer membrane protein [Sphingobacterium sp. N143]MDM1296327.1 RagB/SusD family nutrient uptake outer membrane protein [Sphingobacterium sp. N143]